MQPYSEAQQVPALESPHQLVTDPSNRHIPFSCFLYVCERHRGTSKQMWCSVILLCSLSGDGSYFNLYLTSPDRFLIFSIFEFTDLCIGVYCCYNKIADTSNSRKGLFWLIVWGCSPSWREGLMAGARSSWSHYLCSQGAGRYMLLLDCFLSFIQPGTPAYRLVSPTFRMGLPCSFKPFWKCPQTPTGCISRILNPIKLKVKINYHKVFNKYGFDLSWLAFFPLCLIVYMYFLFLIWHIYS